MSEAPFLLPCPRCSQVVPVVETQAWERVRCHGCGRSFVPVEAMAATNFDPARPRATQPLPDPVETIAPPYRWRIGRRTLLAAGVAIAAGAVGGYFAMQESSPWLVGDGINENLQGRQIFPSADPWNTDISGQPTDINTARYIASIGFSRHLHPDFGANWRGRVFGIPYVVVRGSQPKVKIEFAADGESDPGPYPIPADPPYEGGPESTGDRHLLIVDRDAWKLYELFDLYPTPHGYRAGSGAIFDLKENTARPDGWTSADAAGLPILPGLVRYDEVFERGVIDHALRFTARLTRRAYLPPARHFASTRKDQMLPPMGLRLRLRGTLSLAGFSRETKVVLLALQQYGMFLADNGLDWALTGTADLRWPRRIISELKTIKGSDFEVVRVDPDRIVVG